MGAAQNVQGFKELLGDDADADAVSSLERTFQLPLRSLEPPDDHPNPVQGEKPFLLLVANRIGADPVRYRSPWTGVLYDPSDPSDQSRRDRDDSHIRLFEAKFNSVWESYKNLYYGYDSVGSVYLKQLDDAGTGRVTGSFSGVFGIRKRCAAGSWNSLHHVRVEEPGDKTCVYRVESSVVLVLEPCDDPRTTMDIAASLSKETIKTCKISQAFLAGSHVENIGVLIESNEIDLRSSLERVHIPKTQEILDDLKKLEPKKPAMVNPLMGMIMNSDMLKKKLAKEQDGSSGW
jgi:hypothetical protein